jgi:hypothetical protein
MSRKSDRTMKAVRKETMKSFRKVVISAQQNLVIATPKDTSWASSNWIISTGRPFQGLAGSKENVSLAEATSSQSSVANWDPFKGPVFITNNVPYIGLLNAGFSPQARPGFVQEAVRRAVDSTRGR